MMLSHNEQIIKSPCGKLLKFYVVITINMYSILHKSHLMIFWLGVCMAYILMVSFDSMAYIAIENTNIPFQIYLNFQILITGNV